MDELQRLRTCRSSIRVQRDRRAIDEIRLALKQNLPLGGSRFFRQP
jgi:hypothetical protein